MPFSDHQDEAFGFSTEHIKLEGVFLNGIESPNESTRELIQKIKGPILNNVFYLFEGDEEKFESLENEVFGNTTMNLSCDGSLYKTVGKIWLGKASFARAKSLLFEVPNSNAYLKFETTVVGDRLKNNLPLEINFQGVTDGLTVSFSVQELKRES
ncbi:MAG: hypothetical protein RLY43_2400 [Bacteroidota bacterium]|jgi:hypothetical protein